MHWLDGSISLDENLISGRVSGGSNGENSDNNQSKTSLKASRLRCASVTFQGCRCAVVCNELPPCIVGFAFQFRFRFRFQLHSLNAHSTYLHMEHMFTCYFKCVFIQLCSYHIRIFMRRHARTYVMTMQIASETNSRLFDFY